jgi:hypothetical protein
MGYPGRLSSSDPGLSPLSLDRERDPDRLRAGELLEDGDLRSFCSFRDGLPWLDSSSVNTDVAAVDVERVENLIALSIVVAVWVDVRLAAERDRFGL